MRHEIWTYQGDMRCPCHEVYSKVETKGRFNRTLRLKCKVTGQVFMKSEVIGDYFKPQNIHEAQEQTAVMILVSQIKGGELIATR